MEISSHFGSHFSHLLYVLRPTLQSQPLDCRSVEHMQTHGLFFMKLFSFHTVQSLDSSPFHVVLHGPCVSEYSGVITKCSSLQELTRLTSTEYLESNEHTDTHSYRIHKLRQLTLIVRRLLTVQQIKALFLLLWFEQTSPH